MKVSDQHTESDRHIYVDPYIVDSQYETHHIISQDNKSDTEHDTIICPNTEDMPDHNVENASRNMENARYIASNVNINMSDAQRIVVAPNERPELNHSDVIVGAVQNCPIDIAVDMRPQLVYNSQNIDHAARKIPRTDNLILESDDQQIASTPAESNAYANRRIGTVIHQDISVEDAEKDASLALPTKIEEQHPEWPVALSKLLKGNQSKRPIQIKGAGPVPHQVKTRSQGPPSI